MIMSITMRLYLFQPTGKFTIVGYGTAGVTAGAALTITHDQGSSQKTLLQP